MRKIYFLFHFCTILFISIFSTLISFLDFHEMENRKIKNFYANFISNPLIVVYTQFSGCNTGYGFYGINVATNKYFSIKVYDENNKFLIEHTNFKFKNKNNEDRFKTLASRISLDILDIQKLKKENNLKKNSTELNTMNEYKNKIFKYLAKETVYDYKNMNVTVQLNFVMPDDIWNKNYNLNTKIGVNEKNKFNRMDYK
jgi:hypothetical protein